MWMCRPARWPTPTKRSIALAPPSPSPPPPAPPRTLLPPSSSACSLRVMDIQPTPTSIGASMGGARSLRHRRMELPHRAALASC